MAKILYFFLSISIALPSLSQKINTSTYLKNINTAELLVVDGKYKEASGLFNISLENYESPFAKDYYNGAVCNILSGDRGKAVSYIKILLKKGMSINEIAKNPVVADITTTNPWKRLVRNSIKNTTKSPITPELSLKAKLDELYERDQYFRRLEGSYQKYGDTIRAIDKFNDKALHSLIEENGYPTEDMVGIKENSPFINSEFDIIIWHQTKKNFISDYTSILTEASRTGRIDPHRAAELMENQAGKPLYNSAVFVKFDCDKGCSFKTNLLIKNKLFYSLQTLDQESTTDSRRAEIGLEPLSDYRKKIRFSIKDDKFLFGYRKDIPVLSFAEESVLLKVLQKFKAVDE